MTASVSVTPTFASSTKTSASAVAIAASAWRATAPKMPLALGSQPPVSCTQNRVVCHSAR